jgi:hypothetical protein
LIEKRVILNNWDLQKSLISSRVVYFKPS